VSIRRTVLTCSWWKSSQIAECLQ